MFNIKFYTFRKRTNSTLTPATAGVQGDTFQCTVKSPASILTPVVELKIENNNSAPSYNYAYIEDFGARYYFITNKVFNEGLWIFTLSVDVLATYAGEIADSEQYVLRASQKYDGDIVDNFYLRKASKPTINITRRSYANKLDGTNKEEYYFGGNSGYTNLFHGSSYSQGSFVLGILGANATGVDYYIFTYNGFRSLVNSLCSFTPSSGDVPADLARAMIDITQYITLCRWYPFIPSSYGTSVSSVNFGNYSVSVSGCKTLNPCDMLVYKMEFPLLRHPDRTAMTKYLDLAPFSERTLYVGPFGYFPIDTTKIYDTETIEARVSIDLASGVANLTVTPLDPEGFGPSAAPVVTNRSEYGVVIPVSTLVTD